MDKMFEKLYKVTCDSTNNTLKESVLNVKIEFVPIKEESSYCKVCEYVPVTPIVKHADSLLLIVEGIRAVCDVPQIISEKIDEVLDIIYKEEKELLEK